jgi:hypothetical protein
MKSGVGRRYKFSMWSYASVEILASLKDAIFVSTLKLEILGLKYTSKPYFSLFWGMIRCWTSPNPWGIFGYIPDVLETSHHCLGLS